MARILLVVGALFALGAAVWIWTAEDEASPDAVTDPPSTVGRLRAAREGRTAPGTVLPDNLAVGTRAPADPKPLAPTPGATPAAPEAAAPTRSVSGTVLRVSDESPLSGLAVRVQSADGEAIEVLTGDNPPGSFTLHDVPRDVDQLELESRSEWPTRRASHELEPGPGDVHGLVLHFDSGFAVAGRVTDEHGAPIPHAQPDARSIDGPPAEATGRFFLPDIAPAVDTESVEVGARAPWYQRNTVSVVVPRDSSVVPSVEIQLVGSGALEGTVTDDTGEAVMGATVKLAFLMTTEHAQSAPAGLEATSLEKGRYRIDHVPPGRYIVQADLPDLSIFSSQSVDASSTKPSPGLVGVWLIDVGVVVREATRLDIALPRSASVGGRISDTYGTPLPGVEVLLQKAVRWPAPDLRGSSSTSSSDLRIVSTGSSDGTGETLLTTTEGRTTSDESGDYLFTRVTPGEKLLTVTDAGGEHVTRRVPFSVARGRPHSQDIQLPTGLTVRARVVDTGGAPIEGASVQVQPPDTRVFDSGNRETTDAGGYFELTGLQPATMSLFIYKTGYVALFEDIDTAAPKTEYVMEPAPSVNGRVLDALHDEPITNFTVSVSVADSTWSNQSTFEDGVFKMDVNGDELATVSIEAPGYEPQNLEGVRPSETATRPLEFRLYQPR